MFIPQELNPPIRILMGPGPSDVHPRVLKAMNTRLLGHLDPAFLKIMDDVKMSLREVFQTQNDWTLPVSGTGTAGMETCIVNLIEEGDEVAVCTAGYFGDRIADMATRFGAKVHRIEAPWGKTIEEEKLESVLKNSKIKIVTVVNAETSTGVYQSLDEISRLAHEHGALLLVDAVTSLGGLPVEVDKLKIDACYSGTQKCLGAPPGLAPTTLSNDALDVISKRRQKVYGWYLDLTLLNKYWGKERVYHHTAPITMVYALYEALRVLLEEGLENSFTRHKIHHHALVAGLEAIGLDMLVEPQFRLPMLNTPKVPEGIDDAKVRRRLLNEFNIEIGAGFSVLAGKIWRIGLMGYSANKRNVLYFLSALENILHSEGYKLDIGASLKGANQIYDQTYVKNH